MLEAGSLYVANDEEYLTRYSQEDLLLKVFCQDTTGAGVRIQWFWRPETVVMMAMKNPTLILAIDLHGNRFTGEQMMNIIVQSRNNDYTQV
jgi:succinylglutamate desuccinylase